MLKKFFSLCLILTCASFFLAACGHDQADGNSKKIAIMTYTKNDTFSKKLIASMKESAQANGMEVDIYNANDSSDTQIAQVKKVAKMNYAAILIRPVEANNSQEITAIAGKTPIIFYNLQPEKSVLKPNQDIYVGPNEELAGKLQANYVLKQTSDKDTINVAILRGPSGLAAEKRTSAFQDTLRKAGKNVNYVFLDNGKWDFKTAQHLTELFLKTNQPCDALVANNDDMALGAIAAFKQAKRKLPIVCGVDLSAAGKKSIQNNQLAFSAYQPTDSQGKTIIKAALLLANKKKVTDLKGASDDDLYVYTSFEGVTAENVANY